MKSTKDNTDSSNEVKIFKPKPIRRCPLRKMKKSPSSSSTSSSNSEKSQNHYISDSSKNISVNLDEISLEEINNDFSNFGENLEEELCHNELFNIIMSSENNYNDDNTPKIRRFKNPYEINMEYMKDSF
jgi:hypothetical protein